MFLVVILYILFASTFTFSKAALDYCPPFFLIAVRFLVAGIALVGYQFLKEKNSLKINKKDYWLFFQTMLFTFYLSFTTDCWSLQYLSSAKACLIYNISPFITALWVYVLYNQTISFKQGIALIIAFLAYIPLVMTDALNNGTSFYVALPELVLIVSVIISCYGWLVIKTLVVNKGYASITVNGIGILGAGVLALVHALLVEGVPTIHSHGAYHPPLLLNSMYYLTGPVYLDKGMFIFYTVLLIIIAHLVCYTLYTHLLKKYSATFLSLAGGLTPLCAALLGWFFLDEKLSKEFFATISMVCMALCLFYQDELKRHIF